MELEVGGAQHGVDAGEQIDERWCGRAADIDELADRAGGIGGNGGQAVGDRRIAPPGVGDDPALAGLLAYILNDVDEAAPILGGEAHARRVAADEQANVMGAGKARRGSRVAGEGVGIEAGWLQGECMMGAAGVARIRRQHEREAFGAELPERAIEHVRPCQETGAGDVGGEGLRAGRDDDIDLGQVGGHDPVNGFEHPRGAQTYVRQCGEGVARPAAATYLEAGDLHRAAAGERGGDPFRQVEMTGPAIREQQDAERSVGHAWRRLVSSSGQIGRDGRSRSARRQWMPGGPGRT